MYNASQGVNFTVYLPCSIFSGYTHSRQTCGMCICKILSGKFQKDDTPKEKNAINKFHCLECQYVTVFLVVFSSKLWDVNSLCMNRGYW